jgi:omega-6 fatty acid desaturase (delta-12 desaturase)
MASIPELQEAKTTTLNPADIVACFRLKVWDTQTNCMVGVKDLQYSGPQLV